MITMPSVAADVRPDTIAGLIGQDALKRNLQHNLALLVDEFDTQVRREANSHTGLVDHGDWARWERATGMAPGAFKGRAFFISGAAGMGKSTVAEVFAKELAAAGRQRNWPRFTDTGSRPQGLLDRLMGRPAATPTDQVEVWVDQGPPNRYYQYAYIEGATLRRARDLDAYLHFVQPMGVLFIDEAHGMHPSAQDGLLDVLERGEWMDGIIGRRTGHQSWVLMLATNYEDKIRTALRQGRTHRLVMEPYTETERSSMVGLAASKCGVRLPAWMVDEVVRRTGGVPRKIVGATIDLCGFLRLNPQHDRDMVLRFFRDTNLYPTGIDSRGVQVLRVLSRNDDRTISIGDLVQAAGLTRNVWDAEVRPSLVNDGDMLIEVTRGVRITPRGREILSEVDF